MLKIRLISVLLFLSLLSACVQSTPSPTRTRKIGVVIDAGSETDKSFNEYTLKGAMQAAEEAGVDFAYLSPQSASDYERTIESLVTEEQPDLVITVGFRMGSATAQVARRYPDLHFAIVDNAYTPGAGCSETVIDCYTKEGGLSNITTEEEVGYLAGVLAACISKTGIIASVAGQEIPPVVRFVSGYQNGARSIEPEIKLLNQFIPDFNDPATGKVQAQDFIRQGADVIFGVAGNTGNGALLAAYESGLMAIGVDMDQYFTYPEVREALLTSASKKVDVAAASAVKDFLAGKLEPGIRMANLSNGGVGLAPYHDWDHKIPGYCKEKVEAAENEFMH
jgi:basic membrane protein A